MLTNTSEPTELVALQRQPFVEAQRYIGYRVRMHRPFDTEITHGTTGTVEFVMATSDTVFVGLAWDCLAERTFLYGLPLILRSVWLIGGPYAAPLPPRRRVREFTWTSAVNRIGRPVLATTRVTATVRRGDHGTVRAVIRDRTCLMVAVGWSSPDARPDSTWFSRAAYGRYLREGDASR